MSESLNGLHEEGPLVARWFQVSVPRYQRYPRLRKLPNEPTSQIRVLRVHSWFNQKITKRSQRWKPTGEHSVTVPFSPSVFNPCFIRGYTKSTKRTQRLICD
jgi:hypothetical protein